SRCWRSASGSRASCTTRCRRRFTALRSAPVRHVRCSTATLARWRTRSTTCCRWPTRGWPRCARSSSSCGPRRSRRGGRAGGWGARHGIAVEAALCDEPDVPLELKEPLYRIAQEALHNTVKHARARRVTLRLDCSPAEIVLEVADDGVGFDPAAAHPGHLG